MTSAVMATYRRAGVSFTHGEGCRLFDRGGRAFLDFAGGIAVCTLGHAHPKLVRALHEQAQRLWHCSNLFEVEGQERIARRLIAASFGEMVFFANSGAEANECAIKLARRHHAAAGRPQRWRILCFEGSFHGRTLATLAAAGHAGNLRDFGPVTPGFVQVPYGDLEAAARAIDDQTAAILVEPIQGDGGIRVAPRGFLSGLRRLADDHGALLMLDEIQTGMGRTGVPFAHHSAGIEPDVMTLAKGLGGGFPVGACVATRAAAAAMTAGSHGSTFGGNPLAMAVADAVLDEVMSPGFLDAVARAGERLMAGLARLVGRHPGILAAARGQGLMAGLQCRAGADAFCAALRDAGLLVAPARGEVLRFLPPLIVGEAEIDEALSIVDAVAARMRRAG